MSFKVLTLSSHIADKNTPHIKSLTRRSRNKQPRAGIVNQKAYSKSSFKNYLQYEHEKNPLSTEDLETRNSKNASMKLRSKSFPLARSINTLKTYLPLLFQFHKAFMIPALTESLFFEIFLIFVLCPEQIVDLTNFHGS